MYDHPPRIYPPHPADCRCFDCALDAASGLPLEAGLDEPHPNWRKLPPEPDGTVVAQPEPVAATS